MADSRHQRPPRTTVVAVLSVAQSRHYRAAPQEHVVAGRYADPVGDLSEVPGRRERPGKSPQAHLVRPTAIGATARRAAARATAPTDAREPLFHRVVRGGPRLLQQPHRPGCGDGADHQRRRSLPTSFGRRRDGTRQRRSTRGRWRQRKPQCRERAQVLATAGMGSSHKRERNGALGTGLAGTTSRRRPRWRSDHHGCRPPPRRAAIDRVDRSYWQ